MLGTVKCEIVSAKKEIMILIYICCNSTTQSTEKNFRELFFKVLKSVCVWHKL